MFFGDTVYVFCALYKHFNYMSIFFTAYWTLHYIAPCIVFYKYDCAFVTFFIESYLTFFSATCAR